VTAPASPSTLAQIIKAVEEAQASRAPISTLRGSLRGALPPGRLRLPPLVVCLCCASLCSDSRHARRILQALVVLVIALFPVPPGDCHPSHRGEWTGRPPPVQASSSREACTSRRPADQGAGSRQEPGRSLANQSLVAFSSHRRMPTPARLQQLPAAWPDRCRPSSVESIATSLEG